MPPTAAQNEALADFVKGILSGSIDIGITLLPLMGAYKAAKSDPEWREQGFQAWLSNDPKAVQMLERVLRRVKETLPYEKRAALIIALGGLPGEE